MRSFSDFLKRENLLRGLFYRIVRELRLSLTKLEETALN